MGGFWTGRLGPLIAHFGKALFVLNYGPFPRDEATMKLQLRRIDDQLVCTLPDEVVARLGWGPGDTVDLDSDGSVLKIVRTQTAYDRAMKIARKVMDEYHSTLETLAKT